MHSGCTEALAPSMVQRGDDDDDDDIDLLRGRLTDPGNTVIFLGDRGLLLILSNGSPNSLPKSTQRSREVGTLMLRALRRLGGSITAESPS